MNSRTPNAWQAYHGAKMVVEHTAAPKIWLRIHDNAVQWVIMSQSSATSKNLKALNRIDLDLVAHLSEFSAANWHSLCSAAGMTVYGATALSWCKDAELSQVWEGWHASGFPLKPSPEFERPARFINPALMPPSRSLREFLDAEAGRHENPEIHTLAICARIAAVQGTLSFDMPQESLRNAPPQIAAFLKSRLFDKPDRTAAENALIAIWSDTLSGTEFDIWEDA